MNKVTADEVKARNYNLDIKNPHMSQDDHEELLLSLNAAEAESRGLAGAVEGGIGGGAAAIGVERENPGCCVSSIRSTYSI